MNFGARKPAIRMITGMLFPLDVHQWHVIVLGISVELIKPRLQIAAWYIAQGLCCHSVSSHGKAVQTRFPCFCYRTSIIVVYFTYYATCCGSKIGVYKSWMTLLPSCCKAFSELIISWKNFQPGCLYERNENKVMLYMHLETEILPVEEVSHSSAHVWNSTPCTNSPWARENLTTKKTGQVGTIFFHLLSLMFCLHEKLWWTFGFHS